LICGAKSTGKSTLLRYLTNRYLSLGKAAVMVLDCDVGQPEGSPPGMLTLSLVKEPLLSPPHLHMAKKHVKSYFYGHATSRDDPPTYLDMITDLLSAYKAYVDENHGGREEDIPLVVNTDGWVKGFGFEILSTIVQKVQPPFVMQLTADVAAKRFDIDSALPAKSNLLCLDAYSLFIENPVPAQALRSLRTCTYFLDDTDIWNKGRVNFGQKGIVDDDCEIANTLASRKPLAVSIHSLRCQVVGLSSQQEHTVLDALDGSIVGLGVDQEGERYPSCVGLGIVRSIDRARMLFYVLTPVDSDKLVNVTAFIKGSLELPVECVYRGAQAEAFPYLSCRRKVEGLGGSVMKSRNNIARKGQAKRR
jgi:polynucleotide 5'-hydroxyl-kinase GRC3/NOL9